MFSKARLAFALGILGLLAIPALAREPWRDPEFNTRKYDFSLKTIEGKPVRLSELRGRVVVLNFWATWCGPCRVETPGFVRIYEQLKQGDNLEFLAVAVWDDEAAIRRFIQQHKVPYLVANDAEDTVASLYRAQSIPETYLIGRDGKLVHHYSGLVAESDLEARLRVLLAASDQR